MLGLIWAQTLGGVIGRDNELPWSLPEDMAHFRKLTTGSTVIMGRRTWESLPPRFRPLPDRRNIVLTRQSNWRADGAETLGSLPADLDGWVIGGAEIYREALPHADRLCVTYIDAEVDGDAFAPALDNSWREVTEVKWLVAANGLRFRFAELRRAATPLTSSS